MIFLSGSKSKEKTIIIYKKALFPKSYIKNAYFCTLYKHNKTEQKPRPMIIEGYPNARKRHCETGVFVSMMKYLGYEISEPMTFGIGAGLYFLYTPFLKLQNTIYPIFRTWPVSVIHQNVNLLHLPFHEMRFRHHPEKAQEALDALIAKGIPVGVVVNVNGLEYFNVSGGGIDFNGHIISVLGKENGVYTIADTDSRLTTDDYYTVDETTMQKIRFAPGLAAPHGQMFYFDPLPDHFAETVDLRHAAKVGLEKTCHNMLSIPFRYFGWKGIGYFARDMRQWEKKYTHRQICYRMLWYYRVIERAGTGGAGYRFLYADFFSEAAALFQNATLDDCAKMMMSDAEQWRQFSLDCRRYLKKDEVTLNEMADMLEGISADEHKIFLKIKEEFLNDKTIKSL